MSEPASASDGIHVPRIIQCQIRQEDAHAQILAAFPHETRLSLRILDAYLECLETMPSPSSSDSWESTALILASRIFDSLDAANMVLRRGYLLRIAPLVRAAEEDLLAWAYIAKHPNDVKYWRDGKFSDPKPKEKRPTGSPKGVPGQSMPTFEKMREALGPDDPTAGAYGYGLLSVLAHPKAVGLTLQLEDRGDSLFIRRGPFFDEMRCGLSYMTLLATSSLCLSYLHRFMAGRNDPWVNRTGPLILELAGWSTGRSVLNGEIVPYSRLTLQERIARAGATSGGT